MLPAPPRIGRLRLSSALALAPMSGYTDPAFRGAARRVGGFGLAYSELCNPRAILEGNPHSRPIAALPAGDRPLALQIYGADGGVLAGAAEILVERGARIIDLNLGCPVPKVTRKGGGAALLSRPEEAVRLLARIVAAVGGRATVTAKLRLGPTRGSEVAPDLARRLVDAGAAMIAVHGRYADEGYNRPADLAGIRRVVEAVPGIPVFANGDVGPPESARRTLEETCATGLLIGRAALRDPWVFRRIAAVLAGRKFREPARAARVRFLLGHFRRLARLRGAEIACKEFRKWAGYYGPQLGLDRRAREKFGNLASPAELHELCRLRNRR